MRSENNKIVEEGIKKIEEGNVVKKDSLLSLTMLIDFFQIAVYLTLFCFKRYLVSDFIANNTSICSLEVFPVELICIQLWACELA